MEHPTPNLPPPPLAKDDGHPPCWHREFHPITHNHGRYSQGVPITPPPRVFVVVCCWCGAQLVQGSGEAPAPLTHAGATVETGITPGEA
jgi:hypothetical protein